MITLYIEHHKIEEFALFDDDMPHWNKIIKSGIHLCLNLSNEELDKRLSDPFDPLAISYGTSGTMKMPIALGGFIERVKEEPELTLDKPHSIFILDIDEGSAENIQKKLGMAVFATSKVPGDLFSNSFFMDLPKNEVLEGGWKSIIKFNKPLSNSLVIVDNFYFKNEDNSFNRGLNNLIPFLDAYLPDHLEIEYQITVVSPNSRFNSNEWWILEYGRLVTAIKVLRKFPINIELVLAESEIHKRRMISNYSIGKTDKGYDVFYGNKLDKIKEENDFEHLEIFSNVSNIATKHFESIERLNNQLSSHCENVSAYVAINKNNLDRSLFGCNPDKTIKNRLLN